MRRRHLTPDEAVLYRRAMMIALREALPVKLVAHTLGVSPSLIYRETSQGYPVELDPDLMRSAVQGTRRVLRDWAEGRWRWAGR